jgi:ferredoxin
MTYVVSEDCIGCKHTRCVRVCPVDCFREGAEMLVIDPLECIDCGACWLVCPSHAVLRDDEPGAAELLDHNARRARLWPRFGSSVVATTPVRFAGAGPPTAAAVASAPDPVASSPGVRHGRRRSG